MILQEAQRLYSVAPLVVRRALRDVRLGGVAVPAGTCLLLHVYAMHTTSANWAQPHAFLPVRAPVHRLLGLGFRHSLFQCCWPGCVLHTTCLFPQLVRALAAHASQVRVLALGGADRDGAEGVQQSGRAFVLMCRLLP